MFESKNFEGENKKTIEIVSSISGYRLLKKLEIII